MNNLEEDYKKILEKYNRNIITLSKLPKKPVKSYKIKNEIYKPEFSSRLIYAILLFLLLLFLTYQFPFFAIPQWFIETTNTSYSVWYVIIGLFSFMLQFIYHNKELKKYKSEKHENDLLIKEHERKIVNYNNSLREFNENNKSIEILKSENEEYVSELSRLREKMETYENKSVMKEIKTATLYCPKCGNKFKYEGNKSGKVGGGLSGATAGAILGSKVGIAMGPLGAIAGTIPGAIIGGVFGKDLGNNFDKPKCPKCKTTFDIKI